MAQESWQADVFSAQDLTWLMSRVGRGWVSCAARGPSATQVAAAEFRASQLSTEGLVCCWLSARGRSQSLEAPASLTYGPFHVHSQQWRFLFLLEPFHASHVFHQEELRIF